MFFVVPVCTFFENQGKFNKNSYLCLQLYFMDESVLGVSLRRLRSSDDSTKPLSDLGDLTFRDDSHYIPVKILSTKELSERHPNGNSVIGSIFRIFNNCKSNF